MKWVLKVYTRGGMRLYGPFDTKEIAIKWAKKNVPVEFRWETHGLVEPMI